MTIKGVPVHRALSPLVAAIGGFVWLGTILALLIWWLALGAPRYPWGNGTVQYISDVGAFDGRKALFIAGATVTAVCFVTALVAQERLRRRLFMVAAQSQEQVPSRKARVAALVLSWVAIIAGIIGAVCLVLLTIFDSKDHSNVHWPLSLVFAFLVGISAFATTVETAVAKRLGWRRLARSFWFKIILLTVGLVLLIAMIVLMATCESQPNGSGGTTCNGAQSTAAVIEWVLATIFGVYLLSFAYDLWPWDRHGVPILTGPTGEAGLPANVEGAGAAGATAPHVPGGYRGLPGGGASVAGGGAGEVAARVSHEPATVGASPPPLPAVAGGPRLPVAG